MTNPPRPRLSKRVGARLYLVLPVNLRRRFDTVFRSESERVLGKGETLTKADFLRRALWRGLAAIEGEGAAPS